MPALVEPIQIALQDEQQVAQAARIYRILLRERTAALVAPNGETVELPPSLHDALMRIAAQLLEGWAVAVLPVMERLSTQAAADFLGVSRQFFVRECEARKLPFHLVGTHRRVLLKDLLEYQERRDQARRQSNC